MKKLISYTVMAFLAAGSLAPAFAFAETATSTPAYPNGVRRGIQEEMRLKMQGFRGGTATSTPPFRGMIREERKDFRENVKAQMTDIHNTAQEQRKALQDEMQMRFRALKGGNATTTPMMRRDILEQVREKRDQIREEAKTKRDALRDEVKQKREEIKLKVVKEIAERVRKQFDQMIKRFDAAIDRLGKLADRIASRLDKAAENGKDVTLLRAKLDGARVKIAEAQITLDAAVQKFESMLGVDNPREAFKEVQAMMNTVKDKIKAAHAALVDVINSLKGIGNTATTTPVVPSGNATSTPPTVQ